MIVVQFYIVVLKLYHSPFQGYERNEILGMSKPQFFVGATLSSRFGH